VTTRLFKTSSALLLVATFASPEDVVRRNPHFRAMPRRIRIRSTIAVGGGTPRYGQLNTNAYRPDVRPRAL
jgi:hypothetical protein